MAVHVYERPELEQAGEVSFKGPGRRLPGKWLDTAAGAMGRCAAADNFQLPKANG
jgi:hypothetical protein